MGLASLTLLLFSHNNIFSGGCVMRGFDNKLTVDKAPNAHAHSHTGKGHQIKRFSQFSISALVILTIYVIVQEHFTGSRTHVQYLLRAHDRVNQLM